MDCSRNELEYDLKQKLKSMIDFVEKSGLNVHTETKARGHQGFFMKNRIDISAKVSFERKIEVLVHEFAHFIHSEIEPDITKKHGSLKILFQTEDTNQIEKELLKVTAYVDKNTALSRLNQHKDSVLTEIKALDMAVRNIYPDFRRSYPFKPLDLPLSKTDAKYLLKYDRVKIKTPFLRRTKILSIESFKSDFPQFDKTFETYLILKSKQRVLKRISSRISRLNRYYKRPSELFARFVEALYKDQFFVKSIAPQTTKLFFDLLYEGRFGRLKEFVEKFF